MTILITGGAGSLGTALVNKIQEQDIKHKIRILDNNEHALATMKIQVSPYIRKLYGSITDKDRVRRAMKDVDVVIHCAAMKNIDITEYDVSELIKTNVVGTDNVLSSAVESNVNKVMFISSDKSVEPTSIYGASKLIGEHAALNYGSTSNTKISIFRSGNFINSNGNVFESWENQIAKDVPLTITDERCMRYFIDTEVAADTILNCIVWMSGNEIFIPDESIMSETLIVNLAKKFTEGHKHPLKMTFTGLRKGEKLAESLFNRDEVSIKAHDESLKCWVIKR